MEWFAVCLSPRLTIRIPSLPITVGRGNGVPTADFLVIDNPTVPEKQFSLVERMGNTLFMNECSGIPAEVDGAIVQTLAKLSPDEPHIVRTGNVVLGLGTDCAAVSAAVRQAMLDAEAGHANGRIHVSDSDAERLEGVARRWAQKEARRRRERIAKTLAFTAVTVSLGIAGFLLSAKASAAEKRRRMELARVDAEREQAMALEAERRQAAWDDARRQLADLRDEIDRARRRAEELQARAEEADRAAATAGNSSGAVALQGQARRFADLVRQLPDQMENPATVPDVAIVRALLSAAAALGSEPLKTNVEEYVVGAVLVAKGHEAMLKTKDVLGIGRTTRIEQECAIPCSCQNQPCRKCGGTGQCKGRCNASSSAGVGNGTYRRFVLQSARESKFKPLADGSHNCAKRFDGACARQLHAQGSLTFYYERCPDCNGTGACPDCGGSGRTGETAQKSCPKCKGRGLTVDRQRAWAMLASCDRWLRAKTRDGAFPGVQSAAPLPSEASAVSTNELERQNALLANLEQRLLAASNSFARVLGGPLPGNDVACATNALPMSRESGFLENMAADGLVLDDKADGDTTWGIPNRIYRPLLRLAPIASAVLILVGLAALALLLPLFTSRSR